MYEDSIYTRTSHYSYEIRDNMLRLFPTPGNYKGFDGLQDRIWMQFYIDQGDAWESNARYDDGVKGINNFNTLPFDNLPYENINAIGKQWIRRFALALAKEMLGQIRGKFATVPIPGESVTLNASELLGQAKAEQDALREELKTTLDELTYVNMATSDATLQDSTSKVLQNIPQGIFVG